MPKKRKPPPEWWLLGYIAQYQPKYLIEKLEEIGVDAQALYRAAGAAAVDLPNEDYRRLSVLGCSPTPCQNQKRYLMYYIV